MVNSLSVKEFSRLVSHPWLADGECLPMLDQLIEAYPYFREARMLRLAILVRLNDVRAESEIERTVVYAPSPRALHDYVMSALQHEHEGDDKPVPGSYFDTLDKLEKQARQSNKTLEQLAAELAEARKLAVETHETIQPDVTDSTQGEEDLQEYKTALKDGDVSTALEILSKINLHNPKKISYFAERKRYLELLRQIAAKK